MTLSDIEKIPREYIIPREAAAVLGCTPYYINVAAKKCPEKLGFPVFKSGNRVKIPKAAFIKFMTGEANSYGKTGNHNAGIHGKKNQRDE